MTPIFNTSPEYPRVHVWCKFGDSISVCEDLLSGQIKFPKILSQNSQNDPEVQGQ